MNVLIIRRKKRMKENMNNNFFLLYLHLSTFALNAAVYFHHSININNRYIYCQR